MGAEPGESEPETELAEVVVDEGAKEPEPTPAASNMAELVSGLGYHGHTTTDSEPPPPQPLVPATARKLKMTVTTVDDGDDDGSLVGSPQEVELEIFDLSELVAELGKRMGLSNPTIKVYDSDFGDWLEPTGLESVPDSAQVRVAGTRTASVVDETEPSAFLSTDDASPSTVDQIRQRIREIFEEHNPRNTRPGRMKSVLCLTGALTERNPAKVNSQTESQQLKLCVVV